MVRHLRALGRHLNAYIDDQLYVDEVDRGRCTTRGRPACDCIEVDDLEAEVLRRPPTKLVAISDADDVDAILPELQAALARTSSSSNARSRSTSSSPTAA